MDDFHGGGSPPELALAKATLDVSDAGGTEYDLIARLIQDHGPEGALPLVRSRRARPIGLREDQRQR